MPLSAALQRKVKAHVRAHGVIAYATESCFGFGCNPYSLRAVRRILRMKRRPQAKGVIIIGANAKQLSPLMAPLETAQRTLLLSQWPGAHTWLVPCGRRVPGWLIGRNERIALRVPAHRGARELCARVGSALVSTSANRAGHASVKQFRECVRQFGKSTLVLRGRIGLRKQPSTIEDLLTGRRIR